MVACFDQIDAELVCVLLDQLILHLDVDVSAEEGGKILVGEFQAQGAVVHRDGAEALPDEIGGRIEDIDCDIADGKGIASAQDLEVRLEDYHRLVELLHDGGFEVERPVDVHRPHLEVRQHPVCSDQAAVVVVMHMREHQMVDPLDAQLPQVLHQGRCIVDPGPVDEHHLTIWEGDEAAVSILGVLG